MGLEDGKGALVITLAHFVVVHTIVVNYNAFIDVRERERGEGGECSPRITHSLTLSLSLPDAAVRVEAEFAQERRQERVQVYGSLVSLEKRK